MKMSFLTVDSQARLAIAGQRLATGPVMDMDTIAGDRASGRTADCRCKKCRTKRRSTLTVADLEKTMVGPKGRPPRTIAEMNEYNRQFYGRA